MSDELSLLLLSSGIILGGLLILFVYRKQTQQNQQNILNEQEKEEELKQQEIEKKNKQREKDLKSKKKKKVKVITHAPQHEMCIAQLKGHTDSVTQVAIDPKGKYIASASVDRTVRLWLVDEIMDRQFHAINLKFDHGSALCWSNNGKALVISNYNEGSIDVYQIFDDKVNGKYHKLHSTLAKQHKHKIKKLCVYKSLIFSCTDETTVHVGNVEGKAVSSITTKQMKNLDIAVSTDKGYFAVSTSLGVRIWKLTDDAVIEPHLTNISSSNNINSIAFMDEGTSLLTASSDRTWKIYNLAGNYERGFTPRPVVSVENPDDESFDHISPSFDGQLIAVTSGTVLYIYTREGELIHTLVDAHFGNITSLDWGTDSYLLVTSDQSKLVQVFDFN